MTATEKETFLVIKKKNGEFYTCDPEMNTGWIPGQRGAIHFLNIEDANAVAKKLSETCEFVTVIEASDN